MGNHAYAQQQFLEFPISNNTIRYDLYPIDGAGFFVTKYEAIDKSREVVKNVFYYDQDFNLKHEFSIQVDGRFQVLRKWESDNGNAYLLYQRAASELFLMQLKPSGDYKTFEIPLVESMRIQHFHVMGDKALIGGVFDFMPTFFLFDFKEERLIALEGVYQPKIRLVQSKVDKEDRVITIVTADSYSNGKSTFMIRNFDFEGQLLRSVPLKPPGIPDLNSASVTNFQNGEQFVVGTYTDFGLEGSTGVYLAKILADGSQRFNLIPYFKLEGYYDHLPEREAARKLERANRRFLNKGGWSTSAELILNTPHLAGDRIHTMTSQGYYYQVIFNTELQLQSGIYNPDFRARRYWTKEDEFMTLGWDKQLQISKTSAQGVDFYTQSLQLKEFGDGSEDIYISLLQHWYSNNILLGYSFKRNGQKYFAITSQSID